MTAVSLHDRLSQQEIDISDTTINIGDDGLTGLNRIEMEVDLEENISQSPESNQRQALGPLPSSSPPPRGGSKRSRIN